MPPDPLKQILDAVTVTGKDVVGMKKDIGWIKESAERQEERVNNHGARLRELELDVTRSAGEANGVQKLFGRTAKTIGIITALVGAAAIIFGLLKFG